MRTVRINPDFISWRTAARLLIEEKVEPENILWLEIGTLQNHALFEEDGEPVKALNSVLPSVVPFHVPRKFLDDAQNVTFHRFPEKWALLYRLLYKIVLEGPAILDDAVADDILLFRKLAKEIYIDLHKLHAFVRFRKYESNGLEVYLAWYRPRNPILKAGADFFVQRFPNMNWGIFTDDESALWDGKQLALGAGCPQFELKDELENLWKTYYASIFNPTRLNLKLTIQKMPRRVWDVLPEAALIPQLVADANARIQKMENQPHSTATPFVPKSDSLPTLFLGLPHCKGCSLWKRSSQAVAGQGNLSAQIVLVGEQPGDEEDREGVPFVGPAGKILDAALAQAGLERSQIYVTNAVKHFKWREDETGKKRIHQRPSAAEVTACRPWLENELRILKPQVIVCLGVTSATALTGRLFNMEEGRGKVFRTRWCEKTLSTFHPSAVLRTQIDSRKNDIFQALVHDLLLAKSCIEKEIKTYRSR